MSQRQGIIHSPREIEGIRAAAAAAAAVRDKLASLIRPGISTGEIDRLGEALIAATGGRCAFFGYRGYPGHICVSVNDEVVHGIGRLDRALEEGDIVSLDIGVNLKGFIGDTAITIPVGACSAEATRLMRVTEEALGAGVAVALAGNFVRHISAAVEKVAKAAGLGIVREYVGHGCGVRLHEPPEVPNFQTAHKGCRLAPGMTLCVEPMLNLGTHKVFTEKDGWTVRTSDGRLSAHFEHMVLITDKDPEILTCQKT